MEDLEQRRLAAIVFADVVSYSKLIQKNELRTINSFKSHKTQLFEPLISRFGGRLVKTIGDGMLMEFASAIKATECAISIQEGMVERNKNINKDESIFFRIGIHIGDILISDDDVLGDGVNIASRIESLAEPNGVTISDDTYRQIKDKLNIVWVDCGTKQVKNIEQPIQTWSWDSSTYNKKPKEIISDIEKDKPSVVILPFRNLSNDSEQEFLADGISEDIISALSKFRSLFVIAKNTSFSFKDNKRNVTEIAGELGVRYVCEGSVRSSGNRIRVTVQLSDAQTGNSVWSDKYDGNLDDIFEFQDQITQVLSNQIHQEVNYIELSNIKKRDTVNFKAWELYQRGLNSLYLMNKESLNEAADLFSKSIEIDNNFGQAYSYLAFTISHFVFLGFSKKPEDDIKNAKFYVEKALDCDNRDSLAHEMLARIYSLSKNHDQAVEAAKKAIECNVNSSSAYMFYASALTFANRCEEALEPIDQAIKLSPRDPRTFNFLMNKAMIVGEMGDLKLSVDLARKAVAIPQGDFRPALILAIYCAKSGLLDEAQKAIERVLEIIPNFTLTKLKENFFSHFETKLLDNYVLNLSKLDVPK
jgi:adenylate cyclase